MNRLRLLILLTAGLFSGSHTIQAAYDSATFNAAKGTDGQIKPLEIQRITPDGDDVMAGQQIVFQFNQPVVPVGEMKRNAADIPITITPALICQWHWLNTSALACELDQSNKLKSATKYKILVQPGITTEDGRTLAQPRQHQFTTQRPSVSYAWFETWTAPGMPEIRLSFNLPVTQASVEKHIYMQKINGKRVDLIAKIPKAEDIDEIVEKKDELAVDVSNIWIVTPKQALPLDNPIILKVETGLSSTVGLEVGVENRDLLGFDTFAEFKFLGVTCTSLQDETITFRPNAKETNDTRCNPLRQIGLMFNTPVSNDTIKKAVTLIPDLAGGRTDYDPWEGSYDYDHLNSSHAQNYEYTVWLPELLRAYKTYKMRAKSENVSDSFGRPLSTSINMQFLTDHRLPDYTFEHRKSVLETGVDSELPIYVTNLQKIHLNYQVLNSTGHWSSSKTKEIFLPQLQDVSYKVPLGIRELLASDSGIVQGHFSTTPNVDTGYDNRTFFSQVTPFHIQAKLGHHNTLVWVTDFATGQPVENVELSVYSGHSYTPAPIPTALATAKTDHRGIAILPGLEKLDPQLQYLYAYEEDAQRLFFIAKKEKNVALLPVDYDFRVDMYNYDYSVYPDNRKKYGHIHTWGTTAQGVYKVGDTLQYKVFVRDQSNEHFVMPPRESYELKIIDPTGKVVHELKKLKLSEFGTLAGEFTIPKTAAVGWYEFELTADFAKQESWEHWQPMKVLVSDFTPSPFRVSTTLNGELFHLGDKVDVGTVATLHAGGPYAEAMTQISASIQQTEFTSNSPAAKGFNFNVYVEDFHDDTVYLDSSLKLDAQGQLQTSFNLPDASLLYGKLVVESAVSDDRGKRVANQATAEYVGRDRFVGLKEESWLLNAGQEAKVSVLVVDEYGNPSTYAPTPILDSYGNPLTQDAYGNPGTQLTDTQVIVSIQREETKASRVKGAGNAYLTQYETEWIAVSECKVSTYLTANVCTFTPPRSGSYKITAKIKDTKGREHTTELHQWALGLEGVLWQNSADNSLEIIPEQDSYPVGGSARYLVKNPYPGAQGVITVERLGVIKNWTRTFKTSMEIIEIPIEPNFSPGFFVSVVIMSPRVAQPINADQVDLGKPAFRMGYVRTMVTDPYKELVVKVTPDKASYKPRESVTVDLQVSAKQADVKPQPLEIAVAVLDESVLDLLAGGRDYFDPYKGFYTLDNLDVQNYALLMRLVGRQKFEKKGATPGGDGGNSLSMRSLFKFVSYWNPSIKADAEGKAQIQFQVPDNLTGWRILAMAVTPEDRMGLGDANFKVNQPIELRPILPNQVTSGDNFQAGFTVMNRTDKTREIEVNMRATGKPIEQVVGPLVTLPELKMTQKVTVAPYKREKIWLPVKTTTDGQIHFEVTAKDAEEQDGLVQDLVVNKRRSLQTGATYGTTIENEVTESVAFPSGIYPDVGSLSVVASPTVIGGIEGAFEYMRDYPYVCWEQKLSKGVMASHYHNLRSYLDDAITWKDSETLTNKTLDLAVDHQAPNGGMVFYIPENDRVSPYLSAYTAIAFNWLRKSGYKVPDQVENKLHDYLLNLLRKDTVPSYYSQGMTTTVRAVALAALAEHNKITRADIKRYQNHLKEMDLFGKAHFLAAALRVTGMVGTQRKVVNMLLGAANETGGKISFSETLDDGYKQLLTSSLRTQCAILSSLVQYDENVVESGVGDLPFKLVRAITQARKNQGHWENTQENMYCMNALTEFARVYEKDAPKMVIKSWLSEEALGETQFNQVKDPAVTFVHNITAQDVGRKATVKLTREGQGRVYYAVRMSYAPTADNASAINSGIEVNREYYVERDGKWVLLTNPMTIQQGELIRVDIFLSLPAPRHFVVVDDPVPGGLEPVNRDLATASQTDANKAGGEYSGSSMWLKYGDWHEYGVSSWSFYHKELRHHAAIFYSDYLSAGHYHLSYVAQAIAPGEFSVMPTHVEEMYDPDVYGKSLPAVLKVNLQ